MEEWEKQVKHLDSTFLSTDTSLNWNVPDVRSGKNVVDAFYECGEPHIKKSSKRIASYDYNAWEKYNVEEEINKLDKDDIKPCVKKMSSIVTIMDTSGLSVAEKQMLANKERIKGNEAYTAKEYEEAAIYYTRSLAAYPTAAAYNNRAQTNILLEKYEEAIADCNKVLCLESENLKAFLRRGTAYMNIGELIMARDDLEKVLQLQPDMKKAQEVLNKVKADLQHSEPHQKGTSLLIEEVSGSDDEEQFQNGNTSFNAENINEETNLHTQNSVAKDTVHSERSEDNYPKKIVIEEVDSDTEQEILQNTLCFSDSNIFSDTCILKESSNISDSCNTGSVLSKSITDIENIDISSDEITFKEYNSQESCLFKEALMERQNIKEKQNLLINENKTENDIVQANIQHENIGSHNLTTVSNDAKSHFEASISDDACKDSLNIKISHNVRNVYEGINVYEINTVISDSTKSKIKKDQTESTTLSFCADNTTLEKEDTTERNNIKNNHMNVEGISYEKNNVANNKLSSALHVFTPNKNNTALPTEISDTFSDFTNEGTSPAETLLNYSKQDNIDYRPKQQSQLDQNDSFNQVTAFQFFHQWHSQKADKDASIGASLLRKIFPKQLPSILGNKLDGETLSGIVQAVNHLVQTGNKDHAADIMYYLTAVPRISTVTMFLSSEEKEDIHNLINILELKPIQKIV